jgi:protein gp37
MAPSTGHHFVTQLVQSTVQVGGRSPKAGGRDLDGRTWDQLPQEHR